MADRPAVSDPEWEPVVVEERTPAPKTWVRRRPETVRDARAPVGYTPPPGGKPR